MLYCDTFLLTFRHIISAKDLLEKMTSKFELLNIKLAGNQKENPNAIDEQMVMHRICSILKRWVATDPLDFLSIHSEEPETPQSPLNSASIDFMSSMKHSFWKLQTLIKNSEYSNYYDQIRGILDYEIQLSRYENAHTNYITHAKEGREEEVATMLMTFDIHRYASTEIAQQLTLGK